MVGGEAADGFVDSSSFLNDDGVGMKVWLERNKNERIDMERMDDSSLDCMSMVGGRAADGLVGSSSSSEEECMVGKIRNGRVVVQEEKFPKSKFIPAADLYGTALVRNAIDTGVTDIRSSKVVEKSESGTEEDGGTVFEVEEVVGGTRITTYMGDRKYWEKGGAQVKVKIEEEDEVQKKR